MKSARSRGCDSLLSSALSSQLPPEGLLTPKQSKGSTWCAIHPHPVSQTFLQTLAIFFFPPHILHPLHRSWWMSLRLHRPVDSCRVFISVILWKAQSGNSNCITNISHFHVSFHTKKIYYPNKLTSSWTSLSVCWFCIFLHMNTDS